MNNLIDGAKLIYAAIQAAKGDISQCEAMSGDWKRVETWGEIFKHPVDLTKAVIVNVIKNRKEIGSDIAEIKTDESSGNAKDLGTSVANLLVAILGPVKASSAQVKELVSLIVTFTRDEIVLFINGLITGLVNDDDLESVDTCLKDADSLDVLLQKAIAEFKEGGIQNLINGAKAMGELIEQADIDLGQCEAMSSDWARIKKWSAEFKDPSKLFQIVLINVMANRSGIAADIAEIKADEASGNAKDLGLSVADLLIKVVGEVPQSPSPDVFLY